MEIFPGSVVTMKKKESKFFPSSISAQDCENCEVYISLPSGLSKEWAGIIYITSDPRLTDSCVYESTSKSEVNVHIFDW